jgi:hypothetical protein
MSTQPKMMASAATGAQIKVRLMLELEGPDASVQSIVSALLDKTIEVPPVKIRLSKSNSD